MVITKTMMKLSVDILIDMFKKKQQKSTTNFWFNLGPPSYVALLNQDSFPRCPSLPHTHLWRRGVA